MHQKSIFLFRQDLRTHDNRGLQACIRNSRTVLPVFILDENLITGFGWLQDQKFWFLREALEALSRELVSLSGVELSVFFGKPTEIISELTRKYAVDAVYCNRSYGRYGMRRDEEINKILSASNRAFYSCSDYLIAEPEDITVRKVFTPYFRLWKKLIEQEPERLQIEETPSFSGISIPDSKRAMDFIELGAHPYFSLEFGRKRLAEHILSSYEDTRNRLDMDGTSRLSPYLRFGVFSVREIYARSWNVSDSFVSELAWREFWQHIAYHFPETKRLEFQENKRHIQWDGDNELFSAWCRWETGYPVVDASMKQLLETNWMHGRARMIVASFLTKDLHIDWRLGEAFFKEHLLDYDENVNFGNWQWSASVGADPKPLRIFNPSLQSEKFDPEAKFIRRNIPSLQSEPIESIHHPLESQLDYIPVIVNHNIEQKRARELYRRPDDTLSDPITESRPLENPSR